MGISPGMSRQELGKPWSGKLKVTPYLNFGGASGNNQDISGGDTYVIVCENSWIFGVFNRKGLGGP